MQEMPSQNNAVQKLKVAILPLDLPCTGFVKSFRGNSNKWQVSQDIQDNKKKIQTRGQTEAGKTIEETSECVRDEWAKKWSKSLIL